MYQLENKFITEFVNKGKILDIDCGGAFFLDTFDSVNFNQHFPNEHIIHFSDNHFKEYLKDINFQFISERIFYTEMLYVNLYEDTKIISKAN
jgi:hypothetical protein